MSLRDKHDVPHVRPRRDMRPTEPPPTPTALARAIRSDEYATFCTQHAGVTCAYENTEEWQKVCRCLFNHCHRACTPDIHDQPEARHSKTFDRKFHNIPPTLRILQAHLCIREHRRMSGFDGFLFVGLEFKFLLDVCLHPLA